MIAISSVNGLDATARAYQLLQQGADALDAVVAGVTLVEDDGEETKVVNATDSDWWNHRDALGKHGIEIEFLCPHRFARKQKLKPKRRKSP